MTLEPMIDDWQFDVWVAAQFKEYEGGAEDEAETGEGETNEGDNG